MAMWRQLIGDRSHLFWIAFSILTLTGAGSNALGQLAADVSVNVTQEGGVYTYDYTVSNSLLSSLSINGFFLDVADGNQVVQGEIIDSNDDGTIDSFDTEIAIRSITGTPDNWVGEYQPFEVELNEDFSSVLGLKRNGNGMPVFNLAAESAFLAGDGLSCADESADVFPGGELTFSIHSRYAPAEEDFFIAKMFDIGDTNGNGKIDFGLEGPCSDFAGFLDGTILAPSIPPEPVESNCDFDGDGDCDLVDVDNLSIAIVAGENEAKFDLTGDSLVTRADIDAFLSDDNVQRLNGDSDFSGSVGFPDFLALTELFGFQHDSPDLPDGAQVVWSSGDYVVNGSVDFNDFLVVAENFGQSFSGGATAAASIPEPSSGWLLLSMATVVVGRIRRRR